jgi:peptidoglycan/LPS O-acetylase OafA/YrhL
MYFVALAAFALVGMVDISSTASLIAHVTFANIIFPKYANDIIRVEWSIAVEVAFYLLFPLLILVHRAQRPVLILVLIAVLAFAVRITVAEARPRSFNIVWRLYAFLIGLGCFIWIRRGDHTIWPLWPSISGTALLAGVTVVVGEGQYSGPAFAIATALMITASHQGNKAVEWLSRPVPVFVGRISYSIYLLHAPIIWCLAGHGWRLAPLWMAVFLA